MAQGKMDVNLQNSGYIVTVKTLPFTEAETVNLPLVANLQETLTPAATYALTIYQFITIAKFSELKAAMTLNLTIVDNLQKGATLYCYFDSDGTGRDVTGGTGTCTSVVSGTANKNKWAIWVYDGTIFNLISVYQIN